MVLCFCSVVVIAGDIASQLQLSSTDLNALQTQPEGQSESLILTAA